MARPQKNNADYFPHDADASADEKLVYIESTFGIAGYAIYFKLLEILTRCEHFRTAWNPIKAAIYAKKIGIETHLLNQFIVAATTPEIQLFSLQNDHLHSPGLTKRLQTVLQKRQNDAERQAQRRSDDPQKHIVAATTPENAATTDKTKENKTKENIKNTNTGASADEIFENQNPETPTLTDRVKQHLKSNRQHIAPIAARHGIANWDDLIAQAEAFAAHNYQKPAYRDNPEQFTAECFPGWLKIYAERRAAPKHQPTNGQKPKNGSTFKIYPNATAPPGGFPPAAIAAYFQEKYRRNPQSITTEQMTRLRTAPNENTLDNWLEAIANKTAPLPRANNGNATPTTIGDIAGKIITEISA